VTNRLLTVVFLTFGCVPAWASGKISPPDATFFFAWRAADRAVTDYRGDVCSMSRVVDDARTAAVRWFDSVSTPYTTPLDDARRLLTASTAHRARLDALIEVLESTAERANALLVAADARADELAGPMHARTRKALKRTTAEARGVMAAAQAQLTVLVERRIQQQKAEATAARLVSRLKALVARIDAQRAHVLAGYDLADSTSRTSCVTHVNWPTSSADDLVRIPQ
jgi:hypothetical protein